MDAVYVSLLIAALAYPEVAAAQGTASFGPSERAAIQQLFDGYDGVFQRGLRQAPGVPPGSVRQVRPVKHLRRRKCGRLGRLAHNGRRELLPRGSEHIEGRGR
jgi:hypothetical protein